MDMIRCFLICLNAALLHRLLAQLLKREEIGTAKRSIEKQRGDKGTSRNTIYKIN